MELDTGDEYTPHWSRRAEYSDKRPEWQDKIPHLLWELGEVFFPIPPGQKGWEYPHHMPSKRFSADSEVLNGYFDCGWSYGIVCAGSLAVVDIDEREYIDVFTDRLPETAYQWSGSREGVHLFYYIEGLETRQILRIKLRTKIQRVSEGIETRPNTETHIGEIKCDPHGYVLGPGSVHPSGNKYGPLKGDKIATISKEEMMKLFNEYIVDSFHDEWLGEEWEPGDYNTGDIPENSFYDLTADDILPWLEPNNRISHPVHGSSTGSNFMKNENRDTFMCWRCNYGGTTGCGVSPRQLLAMLEVPEKFGEHACEEVRYSWRSDSTLHYHAWNRAIKEGLICSINIPYRVAAGYAIHKGVMDEGDILAGEDYYDIRQELIYRVESAFSGDE